MSQIALKKVLRKFNTDILDHYSYLGNETVVIRQKALIKMVQFLKENRQLQFDFLTDITCVDYPEQQQLEMVYHLYSTALKYRIRIKVPLDRSKPEIETLTVLWPCANWLEREVYDLFGVIFLNHPNLTRIMMYDGFQGHPLRKDYPITKRQPIIQPPGEV